MPDESGGAVLHPDTVTTDAARRMTANFGEGEFFFINVTSRA
jgi:hypothetical protein